LISSSRDFARRVDATPDVAITEVLPDLASAEREVFARRVDGILVIPQYFERDLLHGRPSPVALYADASYFLIYQRVAGAVAAVARTVGAEIEAARLIAIGVDPAIAIAPPDPMPPGCAGQAPSARPLQGIHRGGLEMLCPCAPAR
jgi:ABC-2 type transport system permease protein